MSHGRFIFVLLLVGALLPLPGYGQFLSKPQSATPFGTDTTWIRNAADSTKAGAKAGDGAKGENMQVVKRKVNYKEQIFLALGMMFFVAFIMTTADTWNPN